MTTKTKNSAKTNSRDSFHSHSTPPMAIITSENEHQNLLDIYVHDYLLKRKFHLTAKHFRAERKMDSILRHAINIEPGGFLLTWWSAFWDVYFSSKHREHQVAPTQDFAAKSPTADQQKPLKAQLRKYLDDERNIIPKNFLKLLEDEEILLKTPLKHLTPSLEEFQSSKVPVIVIDDDEEEEEEGRRSSAYNGNHNFDPEELLKLLDDDDAY